MHSYSTVEKKATACLPVPFLGIGVCVGGEHVSETRKDCNVEQNRQLVAILPYTENTLLEM